MAVPPQKPSLPGAANGFDAEPARGKGGRSGDELAEQCGTLEDELEALKAKYEMYFLGIERLEPSKTRDDLKRKVLRLKTAFTRNTGLRFRIQSLHARYLSYERMWVRAAREREEGTYRRDLFKARLHGRRGRGREESMQAGRPDKAAEVEDVDLSDFGAPAAPPDAGAERRLGAPVKPAAAQAAPSAPAVRPPPRPPPPAAAPGLAEPQMRALFDAYVSAKKRCNEDTSRLSYDTVARSVSKQIPELLTRYKAKAVDFKVVIKDGKAILKAVPRT